MKSPLKYVRRRTDGGADSIHHCSIRHPADDSTRKSRMNAQISNLPRLMLSANTGTVILMAVIAIVGLTGLAAQFTDLSAFADESPASAAAVMATSVGGSSGTGARRCPDCGVVVSMRDVPGTQPEASREITIRLQDGSVRVITDANPASWRYGERVSIIPGTN